MIEMSLVGIKTDNLGNSVLLLKELHGNKYLPIWIGQPEATAIALGQQKIQSTRPLTHDLIINLISTLGFNLKDVKITHFDNGIFYAELSFNSGINVSLRPSDAIAIAIRAEIAIYAAEEIIEEVGVFYDDDSILVSDSESELEKFKEFLKTVSPDDFKAND